MTDLSIRSTFSVRVHEVRLFEAKSEIRDQRAEVEILQVQLANEHSSVAQLERNLDDTRFSEALARMSNDEGFAEWNRMKERLAKYEEEV